MPSRAFLALFALASLAACQAQGEPAPAPTNDAGSSPTTDYGANPALGRWVAQSASCAELSDVQFTSTEVLVFNAGGGAKGMTVTYSERDGNSITMTASDNGKQVVVTRTDAEHLALATPDGKRDAYSSAAKAD